MKGNDSEDFKGELANRINKVKENSLLLAETNAENVINLFRAINEIQAMKQDTNWYSNEIIEVLEMFGEVIKHYQTFENMKIYSNFYHRIKKTSIDVKSYYRMSFKKEDKSEVNKDYQSKLE